MPLRRSLVTACRWFQPHSNLDPTMATASTTTYQPSSSASSKEGCINNGSTVTRQSPQTPSTTATNGIKKVSNGTTSNKESMPKSLNCAANGNNHNHNHHVNFGSADDEISDRKKKYLTAKYGQHQMNLIKKRLRVEMWMYEQLAVLYDTADSSEMEIDLDELLDLEDETCREKWLKEKVMDAKKSPQEVDQFVSDLLERAKTL